jgi:Uma2 family endonuclease
MSIAIEPAGQVFDFPGFVGWDDFTKLADVLVNFGGIRLTYLDGRLRLVCPSARHGHLDWRFNQVIVTAARALGCPLVATGDTLFVQVLGPGKMPDLSYYLGDHARANAARVRDQDTYLPPMPPPDLAVEIVVRHKDNLSLETYARLGVPEVWWFEDGLKILRLGEGQYDEVAESLALPGLTGDQVRGWAEQDAADDIEWLDDVEPLIRAALMPEEAP